MYCDPVNVLVIPVSVYPSWVWGAGHYHSVGSPYPGLRGEGGRCSERGTFSLPHSCVLGQPSLPLVPGFLDTIGFLFLFLLPLFYYRSVTCLGGTSPLHAGEPGTVHYNSLLSVIILFSKFLVLVFKSRKLEENLFNII